MGLSDGIKSSKGSHKNILNIPPNIDDDLMHNVSKEFAPDKIKKFEKNYSVDPRLHGGLDKNEKSVKEKRKLMRLESSLKWKKDDMDDLESQMMAQMEMLQNGSNNVQLMNNLSDSLTVAPKIGIVHEDQAIE